MTRLARLELLVLNKTKYNKLLAALKMTESQVNILLHEGFLCFTIQGKLFCYENFAKLTDEKTCNTGVVGVEQEKDWIIVCGEYNSWINMQVYLHVFRTSN